MYVIAFESVSRPGSYAYISGYMAQRHTDRAMAFSDISTAQTFLATTLKMLSPERLQRLGPRLKEAKIITFDEAATARLAEGRTPLRKL